MDSLLAWEWVFLLGLLINSWNWKKEFALFLSTDPHRALSLIKYQNLEFRIYYKVPTRSLRRQLRFLVIHFPLPISGTSFSFGSGMSHHSHHFGGVSPSAHQQERGVLKAMGGGARHNRGSLSVDISEPNSMSSSFRSNRWPLICGLSRALVGEGNNWGSEEKWRARLGSYHLSAWLIFYVTALLHAPSLI